MTEQQIVAPRLRVFGRFLATGSSRGAIRPLIDSNGNAAVIDPRKSLARRPQSRENGDRILGPMRDLNRGFRSMLQPARVALLFVLLGATAPVCVKAEPFVVTIPGQGWAITTDVPPLANFAGQSKADNFQFRATSGEGGFNVSIFVEQPQGHEKTHEAVFNHYWPMAKQNPLIDTSSIKVTKTGKFVKVAYRFDLGQADKDAKNRQVNYYFFFKDRWIDVHISKMPLVPSDDKVFDAFENALTYDSTKSVANRKTP